MKRSQIISIAITITLVALTLGLVLWQKQQTVATTSTAVESTAIQNPSVPKDNPRSASLETLNPSSGSAPTTTNTVSKATPVTSNISLAEVGQHNSKASCWATINGNVYDLTSWIPQHPGGERAILQICGIDGSSKFNHQHGGATKQAMILAGFKIGVATQ